MSISVTAGRSPNGKEREILGLLSLSPELILEIATHIISWQELRYKFRDPLFLDRCASPSKHHLRVSEYDDAQKSLGNMRLVCRYLGEVLKHDIFKAIVFDFHVARFSVDDIESRFSSLLGVSHPAHEYTQFLRIHGLNPVSKARRPDIPEFYMAKFVAEESKTIGYPLYQYITVCIQDAIGSFRSLRCVAWNIEDNKKEDALVLGALSSLPCLEDLTLYIHRTCKSPCKLQVNRFSGLCSLSIMICHDPLYGTERKEFCEQLGQVISQSPRLSHFGFIQDQPCGRRGLHIDFQSIADGIPGSRPLTHLTSLRIQAGAFADTNRDTMNLLKSLKYLHLEDPIHSTDRLWKKMRSAQIRLHKLTVNSLSKSLHEYLLTFDTLRELHLQFSSGAGDDVYRPEPMPEYSTTDCQLFHENVLPLHRLRQTIQPQTKEEAKISPLHGVIYERPSSLSPIVDHQSVATITIRRDALSLCFPFLLDSLAFSGHKRLDRLEIRCSDFKETWMGRPTEYRHPSYVKGAKKLCKIPVITPLLFPKEIRMPYDELYALIPYGRDPAELSHYFKIWSP